MCLALSTWAAAAPDGFRASGCLLAVFAVALLLPGRRSPLLHLTLALVACAATANAVVAPVRSAGSIGLSVVHAAALFALGGSAMFAVRSLMASLGRLPAAMWSMSVGLLLASMCLASERLPFASLGFQARANGKGVVPDRQLGHGYPPWYTVRFFTAEDPRGYYDGPTPIRWNWRLNLHSTQDSAVLQYPDDSTIRVAVLRARSGIRHGIQINEGGLALRAGVQYLLQFEARADRPRPVTVGAAEWHAPWEWLGYDSTFQAGIAWQRFQDTVSVVRDDDNARLHFDLGADSASVELRSIRLSELASQREVRPDSLPFSVDAHFGEHGCRVIPRAGPPEATATRILLIGDADAAGLGVRDADAIGAQLERALNAGVRRESAFEVLACGAPGWGTLQKHVFYRRLRRSVRADVVLVLVSWNDEALRFDESAAGDSSLLAPLPQLDVERIRSSVGALQRDALTDQAQFGVVVFRNTPGRRWVSVLEAVAPFNTPDAPVLDLGHVLVDRGEWRDLVRDPLADWHPNDLAYGIAAAEISRLVSSMRVGR